MEKKLKNTLSLLYSAEFGFMQNGYQNYQRSHMLVYIIYKISFQHSQLLAYYKCMLSKLKSV